LEALVGQLLRRPYLSVLIYSLFVLHNYCGEERMIIIIDEYVTLIFIVLDRHYNAEEIVWNNR
jgi:hypothetical protein